MGHVSDTLSRTSHTQLWPYLLLKTLPFFIFFLPGILFLISRVATFSYVPQTLSFPALISPPCCAAPLIFFFVISFALPADFAVF